jgi:ATP-dependent Clp protease ATP-binding subunit ClpA
VAVEHLFCALMRDEESAAAQAALHAFADPDTIASELMALCPGISVVGSERCLPFSPRGVLALRAARRAAAQGGSARVEPAHVYAAALDELPEAAAAALREAGARRPPAPGTAGPGEEALRDEGPLFRSFSNASKRGLSAAGHQAARGERAAVSPVHLLIGLLEVDLDLAAAAGTTAARARQRLAALDRDESLPPPRTVPPAPALLAFLARAEPGADTLGLLAALLAHGEPELIQLFTRQKVTSEVVARARGLLLDPEPPPEPR